MYLLLSISLSIIGISVLSFRNPLWFEKLKFNPYQVVQNNEYYRLITHGFVHADWMHLIVNILVLYSFGDHVIYFFQYYLGVHFGLVFTLFFLSSIVISSLYSLVKQKNNPYYNAIGASGAVSAVLFANIWFEPNMSIFFFGLLPVKAYLFAALYLAYSYYMGKKGADNIGHDAHFFGALYGLIFAILVSLS